MTLEEIERYLKGRDVEPTADMIDMIDHIYSMGYGEGHDKGWKAKEIQDKQVELIAFDLAAENILGEDWEEQLKYYGIKRPEEE